MIKPVSPNAWVLIQAGFIFAWLTNLSGTDSYYSVYLLCGVLGLLCLADNHRCQPEQNKGQSIGITVFSILFALATFLANWPLFAPIASLMNLFNGGCTLVGGTFVARNLFGALMKRIPLTGDGTDRKHPGRVFWICFGIVAVIDLAYLFFVSFPGVLTADSLSAMRQILNGAYSNTQPYYHTRTFELFYKFGLWLSGDVNLGIACFHIAQILFLAACFGYGLMTMYQIGVPMGYIGAALSVYALMPFHIAYSVTMWKDVPFSGAALLFVTALYRNLRGIGSSRRNLAAFIAGGLGLSLCRTNGWYAFAVTTVIMVFVMRKQHKKLLTVMILVLLVCWVLLNPMLEVLGVSATNLVEAFGVPFQQIARVVTMGCELTAEETQLLDQAFILELVPEMYQPQSVDSIKFQTFRYGNLEYIQEHFMDYVNLYFRLGLRYPGEYLKAWVEETKGFWNGGYEYWRYTTGVSVPEVGIVFRDSGNLISKGFHALFRYLERPAILQPLMSIGLQVWIIIACAVVNVWKKRPEFLLSIPLLVLAAGLWLGTPVFAEFRYGYPFFTCVPLILAVTLYHPDE